MILIIDGSYFMFFQNITFFKPYLLIENQVRVFA